MRQVAVEVVIYERVLPAVPAAVGRIRGELDHALACLDVAPTRRQDIALAVTEAVTNVVLHAYLNMQTGPLYVAASALERSLRVTVYDLGRGMLPRPDSPGLGFGASLMSALADTVQISPNQSDGGTCVALLFRNAIPPIGAADVCKRVQATMTVHHDADMLGAYINALAETTAALHEDTRALQAQARHAVARARRLCARPITTDPGRELGPSP
jgi:serine/threonine-protein kinase RsbW/stage II sporulation protein AB (anti-sigma F factor)